MYIYDDTITIDKSCIFDYNRKEFSRCGNLYCKSYEVSYKCGNCKCVSYCSRECQKADWKTHKLVCNQLSNKFTTKSDRKNLLYHNILMKNSAAIWGSIFGFLASCLISGFFNSFFFVSKTGFLIKSPSEK